MSVAGHAGVALPEEEAASGSEGVVVREALFFGGLVPVRDGTTLARTTTSELWSVRLTGDGRCSIRVRVPETGPTPLGR